MTGIEEVQKVLQYYNNTYRHPSLLPLELSPRYVLFPETTTLPNPAYKWPETYPNADDPGVYFIFGPDMNLLYIGKASLSNKIGGRLGSYFQYAKDGKGCEVLGTWSDNPTFIVTVSVGADKAFEACALEKYLIGRLNPPDNKLRSQITQSNKLL